MFTRLYQWLSTMQQVRSNPAQLVQYSHPAQRIYELMASTYECDRNAVVQSRLSSFSIKSSSFLFYLTLGIRPF